MASANTFLFPDIVHTEVSNKLWYILMVAFPFLFFFEKLRLCVVGLAPAHVAFKEEGGITAVDFNVGKSDRSEMKVTGKRKRVNRMLESYFLFGLKHGSIK